MRRIEVVPYRPQWPAMFACEAWTVAGVLAGELAAIYHIGSSAIPGISAKPVIDLMAEVRNISVIDSLNQAFEDQGYAARGEFGIPGRRFFVKERDDIRSHNLHIFETGSPQIMRHILFRDYLKTHPDDAQAYALLKEELARRFPADIDAYCDGKEIFIRDIDRRAASWYKPS